MIDFKFAAGISWLARVQDYATKMLETEQRCYYRNLTRISSFRSESPLEEILQLLSDELDLPLVSLWKLKYRAGYACAKARVSRQYTPRPDLPSDQSEFVCRINGQLERIVASEEFRQFKPFEIKSIRGFGFDQNFNTEHRMSQIGTDHSISIPVSSFRRPETSSKELEERPAYLLNIYNRNDNPVNFHDPKIISIINSAKNRISTTLSSQIEKNLLQIYDKMDGITEREDALTSNVVVKYCMELAQRYCKFQRCFVVWRKPGSTRYVPIQRLPAGGISMHLPQDEIDELVSFIGKCERKTTVLHADDIPALNGRLLRTAKSIMFSPIGGGVSNTEPSGYIVLINKVCPLAQLVENPRDIADYFDWEDEIIIQKISSAMGMVTEILNINERRKQLADQIAHEMLLPATSIFSSSEYIFDYFRDRIELSEEKKLRRIENIKRYSQLQLSLCDGILIALNDDNLPPQKLYRPRRRLDLSQICIDLKYMVFPWCEKHRVKNDNIWIAPNLPKLVIDPTVVNQIFLNLISNSIKYSGRSFSDFYCQVTSEYVGYADLPGAVQSRLRARTPSQREYRKGHLISVEDGGIGIPEGEETMIFQKHYRASGVEAVEARGSGLGLSIVKKLVEDHFGGIWVERGRRPTIVCVFLPEILESSEYTKTVQWRGMDAIGHKGQNPLD